MYKFLSNLYGKEDNPFAVFLQKYNIPNMDVEKDNIINIYRYHIPKIHLYNDVVEVLDEIKHRKIKIGLITDGDTERQLLKLEALGIRLYFDYIIVTDTFGGREFWKPNEISYIRMAQSLQVEFDEMIYVGDNRAKDFAIADKLPIITVEILRNNKIHNDDYYNDIKAKYIINNLKELLYILEENNGRDY